MSSRGRSKLPVKVIIVAFCGVFCGAGLWASRSIRVSSANTQEINPHVINRTSAIQVISIRKKEQMPLVEVALQNNSTKNITAYILSVGSLNIMSDCALSSAGVFAPGQTHIEIIPLGNFEAASAKDPARAGELMISAVSFEGLDGDGDIRYLQMIKDRHVGAKEQLKLILPILRNTLNSSDTDSEKMLLELESQALRLPTDRESIKLSLDYRDGRDSMKQNLIRSMQHLKEKQQQNPNFNHREALKELVGFYERILARL